MEIEREDETIRKPNYRNLQRSVRVHHKIRHITRTPDYFKKLEEGQLIHPLPYLASTFTWVDPLHEMVFKQAGVERVGMENLERFGGLPALPDPPAISTDLKARLLDKMSAMDLNVALSFVERGDASSMISKAASRLLKGAKYVSDLKFRKAAKVFQTKVPRKLRRPQPKPGDPNYVDNFTSNWMEFRYGWTPLVMDVYNGATLIEQGYNDQNGLIEVKTSSQKREGLGNLTWTAYANSICYGNGFTRSRIGMGVRYRVLSPVLRLADSLGLLNPAVYFAERTPLSFVVNWFVPLMENLREMTAFNGLSFVDGYRNEKYETLYHVSGYTVPSQLARPYLGFRGASLLKLEFRREPITGFDDLRHNVWETRNGLSLLRALDAVSLLHQFLKSKT